MSHPELRYPDPKDTGEPGLANATSAAIERLEDAGVDSTGGRADDEPPPTGRLAKLGSLLGR